MAAEGPVSSFPMDKEAAEEEIALLVRKPGFDELTPADIARHMNNRFNINFDAYKSQLKKMVFEQLKKRDEDNSSESSDGEGDDSDSDSDGEEEGKNEKSEVKKEEKVIPKKEEDDDSDDGVIDMTETNKRKKTTRKVEDIVSSVKSTRRAAASNAMKQIRNTSEGGRFSSFKRKKEKDPNEDNSGRFGRMTKLCYISTELQQVTGDQFMKRCDVVKKLWDYIKENNLKDPKCGQFFICDELLQTIFKKKRVKAFGMAKFLVKHIIGPNDMTPDLKAESEREMETRREAWLERKRQREAESAVDDDDAGPSEKKAKVEENDEQSDSD